MNPQQEENQRLIQGLATRDNAVLGEMYERFFSKVLQFVRQNQGTESDAQDVFQKALLQLMARIKVKEFQLETAFEAYLFTACKNLWRRELKKKQLRGVTNDKVKGLYYEAEDLAQATLEQERWELFQEKFQGLSDNCRQLLGLLFKKVPGKEICQQLGYGSENTVRQRIFKCKTRLRKLILEDARYQQLQFK